MHTLLAETSIGITDLKKNPSAVIRAAGGAPVVVLHHNKPMAYIVPAKAYEALMDMLDDLQLMPLVQQRLAEWADEPQAVIEVSLAELVQQAQAKLASVPKSST
jgi:antitoxin StbD